MLYVEEHLPMTSLVGSAAQGDAEGPEGSAVPWLGLEEPLPPEEGLLRSHTGPVPGPPAMGGFTNPPQGFPGGPKGHPPCTQCESSWVKAPHPSPLVIPRIPGHLGRTGRALGLVNLDFNA